MDQFIDIQIICLQSMNRFDLLRLFMQEATDHFRLQQTDIVKGECTDFISEKENQWRSIDKYQQPPYKRVAAHSRNIVYTPDNVRTLGTLKKVLAYLIDTIFPFLLNKEVAKAEKERVALFLEERLIAIRCEYFVQGIICPRELLRLLRCLVIVWIMKGISSRSSPLIGLQLLLENESKEIMQNSFKQDYRQALKYAIVNSQKKELTKLIMTHDFILEDNQLYRILQIKIKILAFNYHAFYHAIQNQEPIIRCLLWLQIDQTKQKFSQIVKKSFGDVPRQWLYQRLCLNKSNQDGWINLKQNPEILQKPCVGIEAWMNLQSLNDLLR